MGISEVCKDMKLGQSACLLCLRTLVGYQRVEDLQKNGGPKSLLARLAASLKSAAWCVWPCRRPLFKEILLPG